VGGTIDRSRTRKDQVVTADAPKECECAGEVVFIIFLRIRDRLADRAERSEVYNRNDVMRFERIDKLVRIPYVGNDERTPFRKMRIGPSRDCRSKRAGIRPRKGPCSNATRYNRLRLSPIRLRIDLIAL
jgi:hypothetical protein